MKGPPGLSEFEPILTGLHNASGLSASPDGRFLAVQTDDALTVHTLDGATFAQIAVKSVTAFAWFPDSLKVVLSAPGELVVWDLETGTALDSISVEEHFNLLSMATGIPGLAGSVAGLSADDGRVYSWDIGTTDYRPIHDRSVARARSLACEPHGAGVVSGHDDGRILVVGRDGTEERPGPEYGIAVTALAWSPDSSMLLAGTEDGTVGQILHDDVDWIVTQKSAVGIRQIAIAVAIETHWLIWLTDTGELWRRRHSDFSPSNDALTALRVRAFSQIGNSANLAVLTDSDDIFIVDIERDDLWSGTAASEPSAEALKDAPRTDGQSSPKATGTGSSADAVTLPGRPPAQADEASRKDHLGRTALVNALAAMMAANDQGTPFTIGLFGDWGAGKSSVLLQLEERLKIQEPDRFRYSWYNAWEFEHTDNPAAGLVQQTINGLTDGITGLRRWWLRWRFANMVYERELWRALALVVGGSLLLVGVSLLTLHLGADWVMAVFGAAGAAMIAYAIPGIGRLYDHPVSAELRTYLQLPRYGKHLGLIPVMKTHLEALCRLILQKSRPSKRLIVFVDDLDRCSPDSIVKTFEAVRLVMDLKQVVVLMALDARMALQAVAHEYSGLATETRSKEDIARDYLGKIIQLPIGLRRPDPSRIADFVRAGLFPESAAAGAGDDSAGSTRREPTSADLHGDSDATVAGREAGQPRADTGPAEPGSVDAPDSAGPGHEAATRPEHGEDSAASKRSDDAVGGIRGLFTPSPTVAEIAAETEELRLSEEARAETDALQRVMTESKTEVDLFIELAETFELSNPRQLRRLRNCYRLLKVLHTELPWDGSMLMLIWQEYLHTRPQALHADFEAAAIADGNLPESARNEDKTIMEAVLPRLKTAFHGAGAEYGDYADAVRRLVLPRPTANPLEEDDESGSGGPTGQQSTNAVATKAASGSSQRNTGVKGKRSREKV